MRALDGGHKTTRAPTKGDLSSGSRVPVPMLGRAVEGCAPRRGRAGQLEMLLTPAFVWPCRLEGTACLYFFSFSSPASIDPTELLAAISIRCGF